MPPVPTHDADDVSGHTSQGEVPASPDPVNGTTNTSQSTNAKTVRFLTSDQEEIMTSKFVGKMKVTFNRTAERDRQSRKGTSVPPAFYRTSWEGAATLSANTSKDTHVKHHEKPDLKIHKDNAFQAVALFDPRQDLNRERVTRHLVWNKKNDASSFISVYRTEAAACKEANARYNKSKLIGRRVFVAEISSHDLIAATVRGKIQTTVHIITKVPFQANKIETSDHVFRVEIPVWIRNTEGLEARSDLTEEDLNNLGAEVWLSINEIHVSNVLDGPQSRAQRPRNPIGAKAHRNEWLACGSVLKSRMMKVMPFDGKTLYREETDRIIRSPKSPDPWVWDQDRKQWVLDRILWDQTVEQDEERRKKREDVEEAKRLTEQELDGHGRRKLKKLNNARPQAMDDPARSSPEPTT